MRVAVVVFPGSNCDRDTQHVLDRVMGLRADLVPHGTTDLSGYDVVVLPGGFSYGDYLRTGAIAARAPVMGAVRAAAARGVPVLGICNGFQVLLEAGLLPGAMLRNADLRFHCGWVHVRVEAADSAFTSGARAGQVLRMPIAHGDGNYHAGADLLARLEDEGRVVFRYCDATGAVTPESNPNGSVAGIAGICDDRRNVVALMPHPERSSEPEMGGTDGRAIWESLLAVARA
jgi:phosphoribosylformylglycinamidine synthase subunit PurQ / glutaminase